MADALPIIQTKLHRPPLPRDLVARPRLTNLSDRLLQEPLILVSAPAGYGKSTLISNWAEGLNCPVAWLSLDEHDSDLAAFVSYFLRALQTIFPALGTDTMALIQGTELPPSVFIARTLINELNLIEADFVLVLDDYHHIRSTAVHDFVEEILSHPPLHLHLVVGTRIDPPISLSTFRARGQVIEIRIHDLRFTEEEALILFEKLVGAPVKPATVAEFEAQSEGWVTGLCLASLALRHRLSRDHFKKDISLNNRYVSEYLISEILLQQSEQLADNMLKTAILDRFCAGLCRAILENGAEDAERFIRWLEASNLFVISLDNQGIWFRYHYLFQEFLKNELERRFSAEEIAFLHRRASDWFAENDMLEEAVQLALAGKDPELAARLVEDKRIDLLAQQKWLGIQNLLKLFPREFVEEHASLLNLEALLLCYSFNFASLLPILKRVEGLLAMPDQDMSKTLRRQLESELLLMWGYLHYWSGDGAESLAKINQALKFVPAGHTFILAHAIEYQILAIQMTGGYQEALELAASASEMRLACRPFYRARIHLSKMVTHLCEGNLQHAELAAQRLKSIAQENNLYPTLGWALQTLGYIHYQWNNLEIAQGFYAQVSKYRYRTSVRAQALGFCGLARTLQALGDTERAHLVSQSAIEWAQEMGNNGVAAEAKAWTYRLETPNGPIQQTLPWAAALDGPYAPMIFIEIPQISLAAVLIAQGTPHSLAEARTRLISLREFCARTHNIWHLIEIIALEALMLDALGARQKALAKLEKCLQYARPGGYLRVFVDLGTSMQSLLSELHTIGFETEYIDHILQAFPSAHSTDSSFDGQNKRNDLTNREIEILELLTQSLSNQEIADHLVISPGTVKQHLYNIYQKLHVNNRLKAVAVVKDKGLLPGQ